MADQNASQQQPTAATNRPYDDRMVLCVMKIWKTEHDGAERILQQFAAIQEAATKEMDTSRRDIIVKNIAAVKSAYIIYQHCVRTGAVFNPELVASACVLAVERNANALHLYTTALNNSAQQQQQQQHNRMEGVVQTPTTTVPFAEKIPDPDGITKVVSKDPAAHADPGPVVFPPLRPTLTGGVPMGLQNGTPAHIQPPQDDPSIFVPDIRPTSLRKNQAAEQHVRKKIQELVTSVDSSVKVDADAEDLLLEIADEFIDSVANFACRLAKHRGSQNLDVRDLQLHLEMHHGIRIPGFSVDPPGTSSGSGQGTTTVTAAGGAGTAGAGGGGGKKGGGGGGGGGATGAASAKRSSRVAAVNQAKKEARLL